MDGQILPQPNLEQQHRNAGHCVVFSGCGGWKCETCGSRTFLEQEMQEFLNDPAAVAEYNAWADSLVFEEKAEE